MESLNVRWFKHYVGMTNDEKLKALYEVHGDKGFACTVMWSKILEKAAADAGYFRVGSDIPYDDTTLMVAFSDVSRFYGLDFIKTVLEYFIKMKMISLDMFGFYQVVNWEKHQGVTLSTPRVAKFRENKETEDQITEIILFLNKSTGKNFSIKTRSYRDHIRARIDDGYTTNQMKAVIVHKQKDWGGKPDMKKFVTADTLFRPGHFDRYLNEIPAGEQEAVANGTMINVVSASGVRMSITEDQYNRAEKGYFTIIK